MAQVTINVACCECGKILLTRQVNPNSTSTVSGSIRCSNCKRNIGYQIRGTNVNTYEKRS